jgi:N-acetylneuraminate synthase
MYDFEDLFVFDIANNHQGDLSHAINIVSEIGEICNKNRLKGGFKLQFRDLDSFIHPDYINNKTNPNIKRFLSTKLTWDQFKQIRIAIKKNGMKAICTPFDEPSVDKILEMDFDIIKVASCSANDWPLMEKVSSSGKPVIISTGGLNIKEIDQIVSFCDHKGMDYSIMHCVSIYPTPIEKVQLGFIKNLKKRYPKIEIGWSTHEDPNNTDIVKIAYALGARIFERHVGIENDKYTLNTYSSNPNQIKSWIQSYYDSKSIIGGDNKKIADEEKIALEKLKRGIFVSKNLKSGDQLKTQDVFFAIPFLENQIDSGLWNNNKIVLKKDIIENKPLLHSDVHSFKNNKNLIKEAVHNIKGILNEVNIHLNSEFEVEFSHHYGIENFNETGATIINCINREYCKKIIVQTSGQVHPSHFHKRKEETFHLLFGDLEIWLDGIKRNLVPGETCLVMPGIWHSFSTKKGCVIEEVSTTHLKGDSVYKDPKINECLLEDRKTIVPNWGRYFI